MRPAAGRVRDTGSVLLDEVDDWLVGQGLRTTGVEAIVKGCAERLLAAGIPLARAHLSYSTLHPLIASQSITWRRDRDMTRDDHQHHRLDASGWLQSPLYHMIQARLSNLRRRLAGPERLLDYPVLEDLAAAGMTDYLAFTVSFQEDDPQRSSTDGLVGSWTTDRPGGFSAGDLALLLRLQRRLALACKVQIKQQVAEHVVTAYMGRDAGRRVLRGQIRRGDGERIRAVIWYSDMRASTVLAEQLGDQAFLDSLNAYFECSAGAVIAAGGEVLRFVGDAVLGIFPVQDGDEHEPARRALAAAADAGQRLRVLNEARAGHGAPALDFGLALHLGEVMFGNIGVPERLEFSVTGPAANLVARAESMTKTLGRRVLLTAAVADLLPGPFEDLGRFELRGVGGAVQLLAPLTD